MTLLALYVGCLALGGVLIGASLVGGSGDSDADGHAGGDAGADHDHALDHGVDGADHAAAEVDHGGDGHDHAHHADHGHLAKPDAGHMEGVGHALAATILSLRFWTFALGAFGMTGVLLELLGVPSAVSLGVSILDGVFVGGLVTTVLRKAARDTVSSALDTRHLAGRDAEVVLSVGPGKRGKIRVVHQGQTIELPAITREDRLLERAERVIVVEVREGTADVTTVAPDPRRARAATPTSP